MFGNKQIKDMIENDREDVAEEFAQQLRDEVRAADARLDFYMNASAEQLLTLTENGDDAACAHYINKRLNDNVLDANDIKYLERAVYNHCYEAAIIGAFLFGYKKSIYKDEEKEYFSYAVMEQKNSKSAHNSLNKAYKRNSELIDDIDRKVLSDLLDIAVAPEKERLFSFTAELKPAGKGFCDYKSAYEVLLHFTELNGRETDPESVYIAYLRGKNAAAALKAVENNVAELMTEIAQKQGIQNGEVISNGSRVYRYGNAQNKPVAPKDDRVKIISDVSLDIDVDESGRLKGNVCDLCGGALNADGICPSCGNAQTHESNGKIIIRRGRDTEALICTQCGSPVKLDADGKTAYCTACGTTFAVNGNALSDGVYGLNYESIRADMPEGETLPDVKFVRASIADGAITAVMPKNFIVMSDEVRRIKYPTNAPKFIYTTPDSKVNLTLNIIGRLEEKDVFAFGQQMLGILKNSFVGARFDEAIKITDPQNIFFINFITAAIDQGIYNAMFFFSHNGQQGIGSWNCLSKDRWFWAPVFEHAVRTMQFN